MIIPNQTTILKKGQKTICSNKTVLKLENGLPMNDLSLYSNLAKKLNRDFAYIPTYEKAIDSLNNAFINYFYGNKVYLYTFETNLSQLDHNNYIYYKEIYDLYNECYSFLIKKKTLNLYAFNDLLKYYYLLPETVQFILLYTLSMYFYHLHNDISVMGTFIKMFSTNKPYLNKIIKDLSFYYYLVTQETSNNLSNYDINLEYVYTNKKINEPILVNYNEWINASIYSDLALFATTQKNYSLALHYFQKALGTHYLIPSKYLPAYYQAIKNTQPSLIRFTKYLEILNNYTEFQKQVICFKMLIENKKNLKSYILNEIIPFVLTYPLSHNSNYTLRFYNQIIIKKRRN